MPSRKAAWRKCRARRRRVTASHLARAVAVLVCALAVALTGCTRVLDSAQSRSAPQVGPILAGQVADLLSKRAQSDKDGNRFVTVTPDTCAAVAQEKDAPLIAEHHPAATDGGHWVTNDGRTAYVEEIVAVYPADFDAKSAVAGARATLEKCRTPFTVTDMKGREYHFAMGGTDPGSPHIAAWSFHAADWACDNALAAAHNAAIEITTCGPVGGYNVTALARDALKRIEALANSKA